MPEGQIQDGAGSQGGQEGQAGSAPQGNLDWGTFRGTLGDLGKEKSLDSVKDFPGLVKNYVEAQKLLGKPIRLPGKEEKEKRKAVVDGFINHLRTEGDLEAIPDSPGKYQITLPQEEGFVANEKLIGAFKTVAHKLQLSPTQTQQLFDWYINTQAEEESFDAVAFDDAKKALRKEFGGLYTRRMEAGRRATIKWLGDDGESLINSIPISVKDKNGIPVAVRIVRALSEMGDSLIEDAIVGGELSGEDTPEGLQKKMIDMLNDPQSPLNDLTKLGRKEALEEYNKLNEKLARLRSRR